MRLLFFFFFQAEDGIRDKLVTGVQTCALPISEREQPAVPVARRGDAREPVSRVVAVTARRRSDAGRERVVLNSAYVRALAAAGLVPAIVPPHLAPAAARPPLGPGARPPLTGGRGVGSA